MLQVNNIVIIYFTKHMYTKQILRSYLNSKYQIIIMTFNFDELSTVNNFDCL